ncbi:aminoglycoside phosphotransferase family protein [Frankia sp. Ag45/Mut15]|uniref:Aminoglycoside phosphotransferase family protein n=1 Tax=Frankia umida TaxID=573489 RepID=A0ABT0K4Z4_9ACTN|nr:aminoglycoside phosphotransferase family protein [Frankia umida]MCK9878869.1 aminoglycoside phosphotransferase family protein [Frankia umida]
MTAAPVLDTGALARHLVSRGLAASPLDVEVRELAGGVSNDVVAVRAPGLDAVVKRALGRLRVAEEWLADPARIDTEGRALRLAGRLVPGAVPAVLDLADGYLVIERAPDPWRTWKQDLLAGTAQVTVADQLGRALGRWQTATARAADVAAGFEDVTAFDQLRVDPFHRTVARRHPDLAGPIHQTIESMAADRRCLVHGDYTPKNVLVGPAATGLWVIDWEVAHFGDPTFDPAWTVGHLLLKSIHRPASASAYAAAARAFLAGLDAERLNGVAHGGVPLDAAQLIRQTGCLLLARVDGKSPAEYLTAAGRARTRALGRGMLVDPPATLTDTWERLT